MGASRLGDPIRLSRLSFFFFFFCLDLLTVQGVSVRRDLTGPS